MTPAQVVLDTNVFVAAGFHSQSHAARIIEAVRTGRLRMVWNDKTRDETRHIIQKIPPLSWSDFVSLFDEVNRFDGPLNLEPFAAIIDPDDRKFAALAHAAKAVLVTQDGHLLSVCNELPVVIKTARMFWAEALEEFDRGA